MQRIATLKKRTAGEARAVQSNIVIQLVPFGAGPVALAGSIRGVASELGEKQAGDFLE
jgi:hypothetical protein